MSGNSPSRILDLDFSFLEKLPVEDRFPALLQLSEEDKTSWMGIGKILLAGENPILLKELWKILTEKDDPKSILGMNQLDMSESGWEESYWNLVIPRFIREDRRRASDYRKAMQLLVKYHEELDEAGFDPYVDGSFTNILKLPNAISFKGCIPEVFRAAASMKTRPFAAYASGEESPTDSSPTLKEYIDALNRFKSNA